MNVLDLLARVAGTYRDVAWYKDTGSAETGSGDETVRRRAFFATEFARHQQYFYTFEDQVTQPGCVPLRGFLRWSGGETLLSAFGEVERLGSFSEGVAGMGGGTDNVGYVIPRLLLPEELGEYFWRITTLREPRLVEAGVETGAECLVVAGIHPWNDEYAVKLFVDKHTHLLRRIEQSWSFEGVQRFSTILYEPQGGA